jgi:hypothetical protein
MKRNITTASAPSTRPNRLLIALAAAWMALSLAIGGAISADSPTEAARPAPITGTTSQP